MSIRFPGRCFLAAALLSFGLTSGASAADGLERHATASAEVLTPQTTGVGVSLPSHALIVWVFASTERDLRGGRIATQLDSLDRHRLCLLRASAAKCATLCTCDDTGRLLRAGLHSSSLGTPPPLS